MVAKVHFETPNATVEIQFEFVHPIRRNFYFYAQSHKSNIGLFFLQRNSIILDKRQGVLNFVFSSMHPKHADNTFYYIDGPSLNPTDFLIQPGKQTEFTSSHKFPQKRK